MPPEAQPILEWIVCFAPVAVLFVGITFVRAKIPAAAGTGLIVSLAAAAIIGGIGEGRVLEGAETGISSALSILYAVWPAMFLYDILRESGAFETLRTFAQSLTQDMLALVLLFAWVFSSFLQSITGFGVPVAVCAPFLVALGIRPVPA
ncbi:MAG TPA: L-lactate permease, partial [Slackia equolifaciens]|nr:L-lactate permease [Slackia equolifaciens]